MKSVVTEALSDHVIEATNCIPAKLEDRGSVNYPIVIWMALDVDVVTFERLQSRLQFNFGGTYDQSPSWSVEVDREDGDDGLRTVQADAHIAGRVEFSATLFGVDEDSYPEVELSGLRGGMRIPVFRQWIPAGKTALCLLVTGS